MAYELSIYRLPIGGLMRKLFFTISLLLLTIAVAQKPLEELAPPGALLSMGISYHGNLGSSIKEDFSALDWSSAANTVSKLEKIFIASDKFPDINDILFSIQDGFSAFGELEQICPDLAQEPSSGSHTNSFDLLETFGLSSITSPSITILIRASDTESGLSTKFDAAITCIKNNADIPTLEQDGVKLYVINDGGDMPWVVSRHANLIIASTNPDDVRKVIRLVNGSSEKSFADSYIYKQTQAQLKSQENSLRISIDFDALANTIQRLTGLFVGNSENRAALDRALAGLYTLGGNVYQISAVKEGILKENILTINPEGGDKALLKLLNCPNCQVLTPPTLAPQKTIAINMSYVPWKQTFDYLQSFANDIATIYGESAASIDLKQLAKTYLDVDLDVALFNWLGSEIHSYRLEPINQNLSTLIYSPAQLTVIPVSSKEAAERGIEELASFALPLLSNIANLSPKDNDLEESIPFADKLGALNFNGFDLNEIAISQYQYKGILIKRIRIGLNTDFSYAFVGSNLVLATPSKAIETLIDTSESGLNIYLNQDFRLAKQSMPQGSSSFSYSETDVALNGFADLLDIFGQPLAYGINKFLSSKISDSNTETGSDDTETSNDISIEDEVFNADIAGITIADVIFPESSITANLSESDLDNYGYFSKYYQLENVSVGDGITVNLSSDDFDTQLWLIDSNRSVYIVGNDDIENSESSNSRLSFEVQEGNNYWLEVSSFDGNGSGEYTLEVSFTGNEDFADEDSASLDNEQEIANLEGMIANEISLPTSISANLSEGQVDNYGNTTVFYHLNGVTTNDIVKISLSSEDFDTQMWLADYNSSLYLANNDDENESSTNSTIVFKANDGEDYWIEVSSYDNLSEGNFELTIEPGDESELASYDSGIDDEEELTADLEGMIAEPIEIGNELNGSLGEDEIDNYGAITDFYEITGLQAGDQVVIKMSSDSLDTQLWLIDATNDIYLEDNDDANDETTDSEISFTAKEGVDYWIEASTSSFSDSNTGDYSISIEYDNSATAEGKDDINNWSVEDLTYEDIPSFEELINLFDLVPNSLRILANHSGNDISYTKSLKNNIYSREFCKFNW